MMEENIYPIGYVSQKTGLSTHVIRVWERRYSVVSPYRTSTNRRLYSNSDIKRLALLKQVTEMGHSISRVTALSMDALKGLLSQKGELKKTFIPSKGAFEACDGHMNTLLDAILALDSSAIETSLIQSSISLSRLGLIEGVIVPALKKIGTLWANGEIKIVHEHMASSMVRSFLWDLIQSTQENPKGPKMIFSTPSGDWHELGIISAILAAKELGCGVTYFGAHLPAEEILAAAEKTDAKAICMSITHTMQKNELIREIEKIITYKENATHLFLGGNGAAQLKKIFGERDVHFFNGLASFRCRLNTILTPELET